MAFIWSKWNGLYQLLDNNRSTQYSNCVVGLIKTDFTLDMTVTLADCQAIEADFSGYATQATNFGTTIAWDGAKGSILSPGVTFTANTANSPDYTIFGWFVYNSSHNKLFMVKRYDPANRPLLINANDRVVVYPTLRISPTKSFNIFSASGNWVCPMGVTSVTVEAWGKGADGQNYSGSVGGSGGGAGAYARSILSVTPGDTYVISIGSPTWFSLIGTIPTDASEGVLAVGGSGSSGGAAGSCIGTIAFTGGNGGAGDTNSTPTYSGGGGGGGASPPRFKDGNDGEDATANAGGTGGLLGEHFGETTWFISDGYTGGNGANGGNGGSVPGDATNGKSPGNGGGGAAVPANSGVSLAGSGGTGCVIISW